MDLIETHYMYQGKIYTRDDPKDECLGDYKDFPIKKEKEFNYTDYKTNQELKRALLEWKSKNNLLAINLKNNEQHKTI